MRLRTDNPMNRVALSILAFEVIVFGLAVPVMILVSEVSPLTATLAGSIAALLALGGAALLRKPAGYPLGWLAQVAGLAMGLLTWGMVVMGAVFAGLWLITFVLGRRLEQRGSAQA